jgi:hypothetical protein
MFHRIALAALLIGCLTASANAQKDKPKPTKPSDLLTWQTVAADKTSKLTTKRAEVPGGWLVIVQYGDDMTLTFLPDADHRWDDKSPSDTNPAKPKPDDLIKAAADKLRVDLEQARAAALAERDLAVAAQKNADKEIKRLLAELEKTKKEAESNLDLAKRNEAEALKQKALAEAQQKEAQAAQKKAEDELKKALDQLDKTKKAKKPRKGDKGDQAMDAGNEAERQRIAEELGLARDESQKAKAAAEEARAALAAERGKAEVVQKQLAETATALKVAITQRKECEEATVVAQKGRAVAQAERDKAVVCLKEAEVARREALVQKEKAEALAQQLQKQLADTTKALDEARAAEKRSTVEAAAAMEDNKRLKAELDLAKKEAERLKQLLKKQ